MTIKQFLIISGCVIVTGLALGFCLGLIVSDITNAVWLIYW